ncbi:tRNA synthetases class I-domain-containing protein [Chaetomium tenue]|uniref:tRNA synthetases class I-domain-containing protein n=1 Tax=Chaetomium tenue TaxID=1854479 RepID=A0ACB7PKL4_9PEZI|nr:tRNA synthetases class I-domain-containing protein [Chaetomium globosum]
MASQAKDGIAEAATSMAAMKLDKKAEKERQKAEKAKKFAEKQANQQARIAAGPKAQKPTDQPELPKYVEQTPPGEKKVLGPLNSPYHSAYIPGVVESAWDAWWAKMGFFEPEFTEDGQNLAPGAFVIPLPPPNVTGALHCGHALGTALEDLLIRWHRMRGFTTLYIPGCDHASISTQSVVEKMLWRRERKTRHDLGREGFVARALEWKDEYHTKINKVLRRLGGSYDWTREAFTMDPQRSEAVIEAFVRLHDEGLIYRANRLVNWCVHLNTTVSNLETDSIDLPGRTLLTIPGYDRKIEFGVLTSFSYPLTNPNTTTTTTETTPETITISTTRLETMLGDVAIAVHPADPRYTHLIGRFARHPFLDRLLPIIADPIADPSFGSGAVKITPAHDAADFAVGVAHGLEVVNILNDDGTMNGNAGRFEGMKRYDVRRVVGEELRRLGLWVGEEANPMTVRVCSKSRDVIEPVVKPQWWMSMKELAGPAMEAVRKGDITIRPETASRSYFQWLENINDWCLSRQLWWGHQIPAYRVGFAAAAAGGLEEEGEVWIVARNEAEAREKAAKRFPGREFSLERDPDVLDTWFSSGLWPFSTLGWPHKTHDMQNLFPNSILESGWDTLFFWIARMIMLSLKLTGQVPFREVYCHSLIRDAQGRKMSKSLGNVLDPVAVMEGISLEALQESLKTGNLDESEYKVASKNQKLSFPNGIPECGADALRFSLISYTTGGGDVNFDIKVMAGYRRFCNKIYQATKYVLGKLPADYVPPSKLAKTGNESLSERWVLHRLDVAARAVHEALEKREFSRSAQAVYRYWYDDVCDVFIETSKAVLQDGSDAAKASAIDTLYAAVEGGLTLTHPFMPFLSEELWQRLPRRQDDSTPSIVKARYPEHRADLDDGDASEKFELVISCAKGIRSLAAEAGIKRDGIGYLACQNAADLALLRTEIGPLKSLIGKVVASLIMLGAAEGKSDLEGCAVFSVSSTTTVYLKSGQTN